MSFLLRYTFLFMILSSSIHASNIITNGNSTLTAQQLEEIKKQNQLNRVQQMKKQQQFVQERLIYKDTLRSKKRTYEKALSQKLKKQ